MTTTRQIRRTPHALQAGATTATLWVITHLLAITNTALAMFLPWAIGTDVANEDFNALTWATLGSFLLLIGAQSLVFRAVRIRIPGGLRTYTQNELQQMPTIIPNVISNLISAATIAIVGTWTLSNRATGDHGVTVGAIALMAGALLMFRLFEALSPIIGREPLGLTAAILSIPEALASAFLVIITWGLDRSSAYGLIFAAVLVPLIGIWKHMSRNPHGSPVRESLDEISDKVLNHMNPAPTLEGRNKARILTRTIALTVVVLVVIIMLSQ